jgi:anti-sigma factor RsiW
MACDSWLPKLDAYLDGELSAAEMSAFDAHVRGCPSCAADALGRVQLKRAVRNVGHHFTASPEFRQNIRAQVAERSSARMRFGWIWAAAASLALILAAFLSGWLTRGRSGQQSLYTELADLHVATLASSTPVDVVSTDRHTVKPWFQGKIPFSFNLPELNNSEFTLLGGRLVYLRATPGAHLIYQYGKHDISVFIFPESPLRVSAGSPSRNAAFNTTTWSQGGLRYFVVGDVSPEQIRALSALFKSAN